MPNPGIDLNNANFKMFTSFATSAPKENTRATLSAINTPDGKVRTIKASTNWDFVGNIGRSASKEKLNNDVRTLFLNTIADMFGGIDKIPQDLKEVMKMNDFGKGKPLTARRIRAVQSAVEQAAAKFAEDVNSLKTFTNSTDFTSRIKDFDEDKKATLDSRVNLVLDEIGNDLGLIEILKQPKAIRRLLLSGDGNIRSAESVKAKIDELKASLAELRNMAGNDKRLYEAGLRGIGYFAECGKIFPQGVLTSIIGLIKNANLNDVAKMSPRCSVLQMHKGLMQFTNALEEIRFKSNVMRTFTDGVMGEEIVNARRAIAYMLFGNLKPSAMQSIQRCLSSQVTGKITNVYGSFAFGEELFPQDTNQVQKNEMQKQAKNYSMSISLLKEMTEDYLGSDGQDVAQEIETEVTSSLQRNILRDLDASATISIEQQEWVIADRFVQGSAPEGDGLRNAVLESLNGTQLGAVEGFLLNDMNASVGGLLNIHIVDSCSQMATKGVADSLFAKNLPNIAAGKVTVTVGTEKLSGDLQTAMNQIARFVSGKEDATYESLEPEMKTKAHVVMSILTEQTSKDAFEGTSMSFSDDVNKVPFNVVGDESKDKATFNLSFDKDGQLVVKHEYFKAVRTTLPEGEEPKPTDLTKPAPDGRFIKTEFTYTMKGSEFKRIAKLDFSKVDTTNAHNMLDSDTKSKAEKAAKNLPLGFTFGRGDVTCRARFKAEMN